MLGRLFLLISFLWAYGNLQAQKHSLEVGYFPLAYYDDYFDLGWQIDDIDAIQNTIIKYSYQMNQHLTVGLSTFLVRGPFRQLPNDASAAGAYTSLALHYYILESKFKVIELGRLDVLGVTGLSYRKRYTGKGSWVGPPWNKARSALEKNNTLGVKVGSGFRYNLPFEFHFNIDASYYLHADSELKANVVVLLTLGVSF